MTRNRNLSDDHYSQNRNIDTSEQNLFYGYYFNDYTLTSSPSSQTSLRSPDFQGRGQIDFGLNEDFDSILAKATNSLFTVEAMRKVDLCELKGQFHLFCDAKYFGYLTGTLFITNFTTHVFFTIVTQKSP